MPPGAARPGRVLKLADSAGADGAVADSAGAGSAEADGAEADSAGAGSAGTDSPGADSAGPDSAGAEGAGADAQSTLTRARAGIYTWIARAGRGLLIATPTAIVTAMTAAALAPVLVPLLAGAAGSLVLQQVLSQLGNIGAEHLTDVMQDVITRLRGEAKVGGVTEETVHNVLERRLEAELRGPRAAGFRTEITRLLRAVNGVGTALDAAFRSEVEGLDAHIGQAVGELSETVTEFRALREDVLSALGSLQIDITRTLTLQQNHSKKLDRLNIQLALLRRELVISRPAPPAPSPPSSPAAQPGTAQPAPGQPGTLQAGTAGSGAAASAAAPPAGVPQPALCPYPGLAAFNETDAFWFHGRERLTAALVNRLRERLAGTSPLMVVGASGAGKSSVLRAGLIPELDTGALAEPGSEHWPREVMTPGPYPLRDLALRLGRMAELPASVVLDQLTDNPGRAPLIIAQAVLTREERRRRGVVTVTPDLDAAPGYRPAAARRLILVIDQFEEVFTQCSGAERKQFIDAVCAAAHGTRGAPPAALVVISVRAGFVEHCTAHPPLGPALHDQFIVGPMTPRELHAAIEAPARDAELSVEPGLAATMLSDIGAVTSPGRPQTATYDPGALPLLAHALRETWERREGGRLTIRAYQDAGGIKQAVAKKAGDVYHSLDGPSQQVARHLLEHMVSVRSDAEDTRRRMSRTALLAELPPGDAQRAGRVLDLLERHRLVTADHDVVQIAHEALLRHWPLLGGWLEENRAWLRARQRLTEHAHEWDDDDRHPDRLLHGAQLSAVHEQLRGTRRATLGELEAAFLHASERRQARAHRARTAFTTALALALLVAATFAVVAQRNSEAARQQQAIAQSRELAAEAEALRASDPATSLLLSLEAYRIDRTTEAASSLLSAQSGYFSTSLASRSGPVNAVAYDPAAPLLASAGQQGEITLWDTRTQRAAAVLHARSPVYTVAFDSAGRFLAGAGQDGTTVVWDARTRRQLAVLRGDGASVDAAAFSPGGAFLATAGYDGKVTLRRAGTWRVARRLRVGNGTISAVAFSPGGTRLAAACADHNVRLWDLRKRGPAPRVLAGHTGPVRTVAFSPGSGLLASGGDDGTVRLWDARSGSSRGVLTGGTASVRALAFSPDGGQLASGGEDDAVRLWNISSRVQAGALTGPAAAVAGLAFSPDGRTVASADADATVGLWNIAALPPPGDIAAPAVVSAPVPGGLVATAGPGRRIDLWDPRRSRHAVLWRPGGQGGTPAPPLGRQAPGLAFSPGGHLLAVTGPGGVTLWNVATRRWSRSLSTPEAAGAVAYRPATRGGPAVVAAGSSNDDAYVWGPLTAAPVQLSGPRGPVDAVAFSPDGSLLAAGSGDGTLLSAAVATTPGGRIRASVRAQASGHLGPVEAVAFSPDGHTLASASADHTVKLWHVGSGGSLTAIATLLGHSQAVLSVSFSSDGKTLATSSDDATIRLWDVRDPGHPLPLAILTGLGTATSVAFEPGTHTVAGATWDGNALFWDTQPSEAADRMCASSPAGAAAGLSPFLLGIPYHALCPAPHRAP